MDSQVCEGCAAAHDGWRGGTRGRRTQTSNEETAGGVVRAVRTLWGDWTAVVPDCEHNSRYGTKLCEPDVKTLSPSLEFQRLRVCKRAHITTVRRPMAALYRTARTNSHVTASTGMFRTVLTPIAVMTASTIASFRD